MATRLSKPPFSSFSFSSFSFLFSLFFFFLFFLFSFLFSFFFSLLPLFLSSFLSPCPLSATTSPSSSLDTSAVKVSPYFVASIKGFPMNTWNQRKLIPHLMMKGPPPIHSTCFQSFYDEESLMMMM